MQSDYLALRCLVAALALGLLADLLGLRTDPWGINAPLFIALAVAAATWLARLSDRATSPGVPWLAVSACVFSVFIALRDSSALAFLNSLAALMLFALAALRGEEGRFSFAAATEYPYGIFKVWLRGAIGAFPLIAHDITWKQMPGNALTRKVGIGLRGVLFALPPLGIFGALFASADPVFGHYAAQLFSWNIQDLGLDILWFGIWSWIAAGMLRALFLVEQPTPELTTGNSLSLGAAEIAIALLLLDALFLSFVIVQFRFFFGGADYVRETIGMTYTQYARGGFFELVWVSFLVLPLLLVAHALLPGDSSAGRRVFRWLSGVLIALLFVIMASAFERMRLYIRWGGLTELRLYTSAFMVWLAVVFVWFLATVLREKRERFAFGALVAGFAVLFALDLANPDNLIVRTNLSRQTAPNAFDTAYNTSLSADSVPALVTGLSRLSPEKQSLAAYYILANWRPPKRTDWRAWNLARSRAWAAVAADLAHLRSIAKAPPPTRDDDDN